MRKKIGWRYAVGAAVAATVTIFVIAVFFSLCVTDKADISLVDTADERFDWSYELLDDGKIKPYEPVFEDDVFTVKIPDGVKAVRITRTMTEDIPGAELEWNSYDYGVEVFLDGELLHSDFHNARRGEGGFLGLTQNDWDEYSREHGSELQRVRMSLPIDYKGKELSVVTYFPNDAELLAPEYPSIGNVDSPVASVVVFAVKYNVIMTVYAFMAFLMAGMFILDMCNSTLNGKMLLLCLYFLLMFLYNACSTYACYFSILSDIVDLSLLSRLYMTPLYFYLALTLKKWWKWPLCGSIAALTAYECINKIIELRSGNASDADKIGPQVFVLLLAVVVAFGVECFKRNCGTRHDRIRLTRYGVIAVVVTVIYLIDRILAWGSLGAYLTDGIWSPLKIGNYGTVVSFITDIISYMTVIVVVTEVIRRTVRTNRTVEVLRERGRQAMESYERLLAKEDATNVLHHEMRHHMTALSAILNDGDIQRAAKYVDAVAGDLEQLPAGRYSRNVLVNVIAGSYLDRAKAQHIKVEHSLNVPSELNIADEDLSVFLSNMLQNALEACERMNRDDERYIKADMQMRGKFLFISCVNSTRDDETEQKKTAVRSRLRSCSHAQDCG